MNATSIILATILTMMTFIYIVTICSFIKLIKSGKLVINDDEKTLINEVDILQNQLKNEEKEKRYLEKQLDLALELYDEANAKLSKEEQV